MSYWIDDSLVFRGEVIALQHTVSFLNPSLDDEPADCDILRLPVRRYKEVQIFVAAPDGFEDHDF